MKKYKSFLLLTVVFGLLSFSQINCKRDVNKLELATNYPTDPDVFIDAFSPGLNFNAWGKVTNMHIDYNVFYQGTASMRIEVPDLNDPQGTWAGGAYYTVMPRNLSGYDALTFWAKASQPATIEVGFGVDPNLGTATYKVALTKTNLNTNWQEYIIPIPVSSKLTNATGMFYYSAAPINGSGYSIWFDNVQYQKLGTFAHQQVSILNAADSSTSVFTGQNLTIGGLNETVNLPTSSYVNLALSPSYFTFISSDQSVATVNSAGVISVVGSGSAKITSKLGNIPVLGSLTIKSVALAPVPSVDPANVISLFSDSYTNVPVDSWNPYWLYSTALVTFIDANGNNMLYYTDLNFVGIVFTSHKIDVTGMNYLHMDIMTPNNIIYTTTFVCEIDDFGTNGSIDKNTVFTATSSKLSTNNWIGLEIPISGLSPRMRVGQLVLSTTPVLPAVGGVTNVYIDNIYFHK